MFSQTLFISQMGNGGCSKKMRCTDLAAAKSECSPREVVPFVVY